MKAAIVTRKVAPITCGLGDHSINFAKALRARGIQCDVWAGQGKPGEYINIISQKWDNPGLSPMLNQMEQRSIDHLILQFTPLEFENEEIDGEAASEFWAKCFTRWKTSLFVHETYFRSWWYPPSWIGGAREKRLLREMVSHSHFVFTASQPLLEEMRRWGYRSTIAHLPISSNFPLIVIDREAARSRIAISPDEIVLVLFGGGNSLRWMINHVKSTDALLHAEGVKASWLLLGDIPDSWFIFKLPVNSPGRLNEEDISIRLQTSDIFLMPHYAGLSAKRGTLMAAMQHGLPVIGTETRMTDSVWKKVSGVTLLSRIDAKAFAESVLELSQDADKRVTMGRANQVLFDRCYTWPIIADRFIEEITQ